MAKKPRRSVFVLCRGERGQGDSLVSVHASKVSATVAALEEPSIFPGGWTETSDGWLNGCDTLRVVQHEVHRAPRRHRVAVAEKQLP